ncbi:MAG: FtsX-like permease family protein [Bacteroidales bacterium]|nr:FtsX-like permease family protein [Bacteroidales bacterium]
MMRSLNLMLRPLTDVYFEREMEVVLNKRGNLNMIYAFSAIAAFILLIACFNFINLSTAKALRRAKEVGIRKVSGATKNQLITQFLTESFFMVLASALLDAHPGWSHPYHRLIVSLKTPLVCITACPL